MALQVAGVATELDDLHKVPLVPLSPLLLSLTILCPSRSVSFKAVLSLPSKKEEEEKKQATDRDGPVS